MRKDVLASFALLLYLMPGAFSQSLRQPVAAMYTGLSAYSTKHTDVFSFVNNQAALAQTKNTTAGVYGDRRFMLAATSTYVAAVAVPSALGNFGVNLLYSGFKNFNEYQVGLAYGRSLGSAVDVGVQFNYYGYRVPGYNNAGTVNFEFGAVVHLTSQLNAGFHVYNPMGSQFSKSGEQLPVIYKVGLGYDVSDKVFVSAEIVKEEDYPVNLNAGLQYQFVKQFFVRAGISTTSSSAYAGVGIGWGNLRLDICCSYHPQLGLSPGLLVIFNLGAAKTNLPEAVTE